MHDCAKLRCWAYGQATLILSGDVALETLPASTFSHPPVARCCFASACVDLSGSRPSRRLRLRWRLLSDHEPLDPARLVLEIEGELKRQDCSSGLRQSVPTGHRIDRGELRISVPVWPGYPPDRHRHGAVSDDAKRQSLGAAASSASAFEHTGSYRDSPRNGERFPSQRTLKQCAPRPCRRWACGSGKRCAIRSRMLVFKKQATELGYAPRAPQAGSTFGRRRPLVEDPLGQAPSSLRWPAPPTRASLA